MGAARIVGVGEKITPSTRVCVELERRSLEGRSARLLSRVRRLGQSALSQPATRALSDSGRKATRAALLPTRRHGLSVSPRFSRACRRMRLGVARFIGGVSGVRVAFVVDEMKTHTTGGIASPFLRV